MDSYKIKDDPQKSEKTEKTKSATTLPLSILTTLGTAAEAFGTTVASYIGPVFIIFTLQGDSSPKRTVDEATDSSKNEKHGDGGRAEAKNKKRLGELQEKLANAKTEAERKDIKKKIKNIRENGANRKKGEEHRNTGTRK